MTRRGETHRAVRISCVRAIGEGRGNRTRIGWVEAICLAGRPGPLKTFERPYRSRSSAVASRASSSQHSMVGALLAGIEQVVGIEPDDSGVAHQRVTSTLHLLGGLLRDLVREAPWRRATRSMPLAWVGWESNPRRDGVRNRYKASVCYRPADERRKPAEACASRSNRERAHHGFVLPPGVEPGPLGFQPSALTNCAKEGCDAACVGSARGTCFIRCLARHLIIITLRFSEIARRSLLGRTSGVSVLAVIAGAPIASS